MYNHYAQTNNNNEKIVYDRFGKVIISGILQRTLLMKVKK